MTSNQEFLKKIIEQKTIFESIEINRTDRINTINGIENLEANFCISENELFGNESDDLQATKTTSFELTTQLGNGDFITFTVELEYDGELPEFT